MKTTAAGSSLNIPRQRRHKCTTLLSGFLNIMKMILNSLYQEKLGILCRIQNPFCQHVRMINKLFTNNTCLVSRLNSIVFLSVRTNQWVNPEPPNECQHRQISCGPRSGKYNVRWNQSIFDRLIPTATKGKNEIAIYLKNGQKNCFPVCILFNCIMGESRTFSLPGQYLCKCIKNKQRFVHKNKVQFPHDRFTVFTLFTGSHYGTWKRTDNPPSTGKVTTSPGSASPTPFDRTVVWALLRPTRAKWKCCETGPTLYPPYPWLYTRVDAVFHCFGTPVSGEHDVISSISERNNRLKEPNCCWSYFYFISKT